MAFGFWITSDPFVRVGETMGAVPLLCPEWTRPQPRQPGDRRGRSAEIQMLGWLHAGDDSGGGGKAE